MQVCKSSLSLLGVGLLFSCSGLYEAALKNSTLLGGLKEVFKELKSEAEAGASSVRVCWSGPTCNTHSESCWGNCGLVQELLSWLSWLSCCPSAWDGMNGHPCCPLSWVRDLPAPRKHGPNVLPPASSHNSVCEPTRLHLKPVGRSGLQSFCWASLVRMASNLQDKFTWGKFCLFFCTAIYPFIYICI